MQHDQRSTDVEEGPSIPPVLWVCTPRSISFLPSMILETHIFLPEASIEPVPASGMGDADSEMSIDPRGSLGSFPSDAYACMKFCF